MRHHPRLADRRPRTDSPGARRFVQRVLDIVHEYRDGGLGPVGAWLEVLAVVRRMDREGTQRDR